MSNGKNSGGGYERNETELKILQSHPLWLKVKLTQQRIREWVDYFGEEGVCVSFSGGKDSTVLLDLVRKEFPGVRAVFSNTGLEYPEVQRFAKSFDNVDFVYPKMRFDSVISTYGYPIISKEVAEAIYYARRIRTPERERERERDGGGTAGRKRGELRGQRPKDNAWNGRSSRQEDSCKADEAGRMEKAGNRGGEEPAYPDEQREKPEDSSQRTDARSRGSSCWTYSDKVRRRYELRGFRTAGVVDGKSQFNKEKYLPLAYLPIPISHYCCQVMKKQPMAAYQRKYGLHPFLGTLAVESRVRKQAWIRHGCNAFESKKPSSQPMSFWTEQDVLAYIVENGLQIASVYGDIVSRGPDGYDYPAYDFFGNTMPNLCCTGCDRTGCMFCLFGMHNERGETRFQRMAKTHPRQYEFSIGGGQWVDNPAYDPTAPKMDGEWENWNPKKIWVPSKKGLGIGKVCDMVNELYGKDFLRYE